MKVISIVVITPVIRTHGLGFDFFCCCPFRKWLMRVTRCPLWKLMFVFVVVFILDRFIFDIDVDVDVDIGLIDIDKYGTGY
jgi:hypothetical protein